MAPDTPLRDPDDWWKFAFIVTAEKDGDVAYTGSDWNEGISSVGVRHRREPARSDAAVPRNRLHRSRRVSSRGGRALQGHPASEHGQRYSSVSDGTSVLLTVRDSSEPAGRRADDHADGVEQRRVDADAAAGRRARQLLRARDSRERSSEAKDTGRAGREVEPSEADDSVRPVRKVGPRLVSRGRVQAPGLPR